MNHAGTASRVAERRGVLPGRWSKSESEHVVTSPHRTGGWTAATAREPNRIFGIDVSERVSARSARWEAAGSRVVELFGARRATVLGARKLRGETPERRSTLGKRRTAATHDKRRQKKAKAGGERDTGSTGPSRLPPSASACRCARSHRPSLSGGGAAEDLARVDGSRAHLRVRFAGKLDRIRFRALGLTMSWS